MSNISCSIYIIQMVDCKSEPVLSCYRPNWQDVCGQTHSQQEEMATGNTRGTETETETEQSTRSTAQSLLRHQALRRTSAERDPHHEELIKTTSCTTEPLCRCLASVTLASESLKVPVLQANSPSSAKLAEARFIFISRTTWLPLLHTEARNSSDK